MDNNPEPVCHVRSEKPQVTTKRRHIIFAIHGIGQYDREDKSREIYENANNLEKNLHTLLQDQGAEENNDDVVFPGR